MNLYYLFLDDKGKPKKLRTINFITKCDYDTLNPYKAIKYDRRPYYILFHHMLIDSNSLYAMFFVTSIIEPIWVKMIYFVLEININFFLSALFFSDDLID